MEQVDVKEKPLIAQIRSFIPIRDSQPNKGRNIVFFRINYRFFEDALKKWLEVVECPVKSGGESTLKETTTPFPLDLRDLLFFFLGFIEGRCLCGLGAVALSSS